MLPDFFSFVPGNKVFFRSKALRYLEDWIKTIVVFGAFYIAFINIFAEPYRIPTGSMEPTLKGDMSLFHGDHILAWKGISKFDTLKRGDIIAFVSIDNPDIFVIKRLVGLPGEKLKIRAPYVYINGKKLTEPKIFKKIEYNHIRYKNYPYKKFNYEYRIDKKTGKKRLDRESRRYTWGGDMEITIPKDCYFMMGDNTNHSRDSRAWGWLPKSHILGKASLIWFPFTRATTLEVNSFFGETHQNHK